MILKVNDLTKVYRNNRKEELALDSINFHVNEGEIFSILGENGAGKTTLIKLMTNLLTPSKGEILYQGKNITMMGKDYYKKIGVVLEGNRNLYWYLSAYENIYYFGRLLGLNKNTIENRANELLGFFGLYNEKDKKVGNFSRGMQQKLAIIISLLHEPKILFLDEPTLGLDVLSKRDMIKKIRYLSRNDNVTVIITSHQLDVIEKVADRVLILKKGKIEFLDTVFSLKKIYSNNKYIIKVEKILDESYIKNYFNKFNITYSGNTTQIEAYVDDYNFINKFLECMIKNDICINNVSKDSNSLEDIMYTFLKPGSDKVESI
ncbi:hypothetical protein BBF96_13205 [Anoxybacter fermentans]|uniref:ABC transporter domain-containing protein n=1 Tax=Anoxybacter fermentans TaxID=1323375 RepID=A0A3S9T138_9FIRM|nr:ABC transporter ATP-binding protein [Anoxybacter fermentans]AZR74274.1 hypothetical protein BBF96_13205 [Anoxybacter fermentans]